MTTKPEGAPEAPKTNTRVLESTAGALGNTMRMSRILRVLVKVVWWGAARRGVARRGLWEVREDLEGHGDVGDGLEEPRDDGKGGKDPPAPAPAQVSPKHSLKFGFFKTMTMVHYTNSLSNSLAY